MNENCWYWYNFSQEKLPHLLIIVIASTYCGNYAIPFLRATLYMRESISIMADALSFAEKGISPTRRSTPNTLWCIIQGGHLTPPPPKKKGRKKKTTHVTLTGICQVIFHYQAFSQTMVGSQLSTPTKWTVESAVYVRKWDFEIIWNCSFYGFRWRLKNTFTWH